MLVGEPQKHVVKGLAVRGVVKIVAGRMFTPGTDEVIVGKRIAPRFAGCGIGQKIRFGQRDFTVVGHFTADGTAFESETPEMCFSGCSTTAAATTGPARQPRPTSSTPATCTNPARRSAFSSVRIAGTRVMHGKSKLHTQK